MAQSLILMAKHLFQSIAVARNAERQYNTLLAHGVDPEDAVDTVFSTQFVDAPDAEASQSEPERVDIKAWNRLRHSSARYAD